MRYDEAERAAPTELEGFWVRIPHDGRGFPYIRFKGQFFSLVISPDTSISGVFRLDGSESEFLGRWEGPVSYTHLDVYKRQALASSMDLAM